MGRKVAMRTPTARTSKRPEAMCVVVQHFQIICKHPPLALHTYIRSIECFHYIEPTC
jgi:hypothetical protein